MYCDAERRITNREADLAEHIGTENEVEYRYIPDEWAEWRQNAFDVFNAKLKDVYDSFRKQCPDEDGVFTYNGRELAYISDDHELYQKAAKQCVADGAFGDIWYRLILHLRQ